MKKFFTWMMAAILISGTMTAFTACSSSDDDIDLDDIQMSDLVGKWKVTDIKIEPDDDYDHYSDYSTFITFNEDGTCISTYGTSSETFRWSVSGNKLTVSYDKWNYETYTITKLTKSMMVFKYDDDDYIITMTLKRV